MAWRCEDCGKMASVEPEVTDTEIDVDTDSYTITLTMELISQCCSSTVGEGSAEDTFSIDLEHEAPEGADDDWECDGDWEVEEASTDATDWYEGSNPKTGKPYPQRYQKHFYGGDVTVNITCSGCKALTSVDHRVGEQASGFSAY